MVPGFFPLAPKPASPFHGYGGFSLDPERRAGTCIFQNIRLNQVPFLVADVAVQLGHRNTSAYKNHQGIYRQGIPAGVCRLCHVSASREYRWMGESHINSPQSRRGVLPSEWTYPSAMSMIIPHSITVVSPVDSQGIRSDTLRTLLSGWNESVRGMQRYAPKCSLVWHVLMNIQGYMFYTQFVYSRSCISEQSLIN